MPFVPQKRPVHYVPSLRDGLNDQQESDEIRDTEVSDIENFSIEEDAIKNAPGYVAYEASAYTAGVVWGIYQFVKSDGTRRLIRQKGDHLEYDSDGAGTWTNCTLPTSGSPATTITLTEKQPTFVTLNDTVLWGNGEENVMSSTDGITWTAQASLPKAAVLANNGKNRVIFTAISATPSIMWWSDLNDPLTVNAAAWQYIDPNNGESIVGHGLTPHGSNVIFKSNSFYEISDFVDDGIIDVNFIGRFRCAGHHTIQTTEDSIIACAVDGVYELQGAVMRKISGRITNQSRNAINRFDLMTSSYVDGKYYLSMPDATISQSYNSQEYVYYRRLLRNDAVQPYSITRNARNWGCYGVEEIISGSTKSIRLHAGESVESSQGSPAASSAINYYINYQRLTTVTQGLNGSAQSCFLITKYFTDNIPFYAKRFRRIFTDVKIGEDTDIVVSYRFDPYGTFTDISNNLSAGSGIDWEYDDGEEGEFTEGYNFGGAQVTQQLFNAVENEEKPRGIQFKISVNSITDTTILGLAYQYRTKNKFK